MVVPKEREVNKMNWFEFEFSSFFAIFVVLNVLNVIIQTVKSIATVKCGAWTASVTNAVAYGLYTIVVVYMNADGLGLLWKAVVIGLANLVGVYVVKAVEIKNRKDRLWKVEATVKSNDIPKLYDELRASDISFNYIDGIGKYTIVNCFCHTQAESAKVKVILDKYHAKYFVSESKCL
jgi:hypothetical protein